MVRSGHKWFLSAVNLTLKYDIIKDLKKITKRILKRVIWNQNTLFKEIFYTKEYFKISWISKKTSELFEMRFCPYCHFRVAIFIKKS